MAGVDTEFRLESQKIRWDPKTIEIRSKSVEKALEPLIMQITTLVNSSRKGMPGKSKKAQQMVVELEDAIRLLIAASERVSKEFSEIEEPMVAAVAEARTIGDTMRAAAREFSDDPCSSVKRNNMVLAARALLKIVTRLLCIADMADIFRLVAHLKMISTGLRKIVDARNVKDLDEAWTVYNKDLALFTDLAKSRQADMLDPTQKDQIAAARAAMHVSNKLLLTAAQAAIAHPEMPSAKSNRDYVVKQLNEAIQSIFGVVKSIGEKDTDSSAALLQQVGALAQVMDDILMSLSMITPGAVVDSKSSSELQSQVGAVLKEAKRLASALTGSDDSSRNRIFAECSNLSSALQDLLNKFNKGDGSLNTSDVEESHSKVANHLKLLNQEVRRAVLLEVCNGFLDVYAPFNALKEAVATGNKSLVEQKSRVLMEQASRLENIADSACSLSTDPEGIKMVKAASRQTISLCPQVVHAAQTAAAKLESLPAKENFDTFGKAWVHFVKLLKDAVDELIPVEDFLQVSQASYAEDFDRCSAAYNTRDSEGLHMSYITMQNRVLRLRDAVLAELPRMETGPQTDAIKQALSTLGNQALPQLSNKVKKALLAFPQGLMPEDDGVNFLDILRQVIGGVDDICKAFAVRGAGEADGGNQNQTSHTAVPSLVEEIQQKQKEKLMYDQLKLAGKIQFEIYSEGADDPGRVGEASIMVNGVECCPKKRGHNIVVLDSTGTVVNAAGFDTTSEAEGRAMAKFINDIPDEHIALVAVQETTGPGIEAAAAALRSLGAEDPVNPGPKSSWILAGYKGKKLKPWVTQVTRPRQQGPSLLCDVISTPAADEGKVKLEIVSDTSPSSKVSTIKINGVNRSPMGRGINIVVLDRNGNVAATKSFDTANQPKEEARKMSIFLNQLPSEQIVCISALDPLAAGMPEVKEALIRVGAEESCDGKGSLSLVGFTGPYKVKWAKTISQPVGQAVLTSMATTPAGEEHLRRRAMAKVGDFEFGLDDEKESGKSARFIMRALPAEEKAKIAKLNEGFQVEKNRLVTEVNRWDEQGNDVIVLAKKICLSMMDMSDFTRGTGALKTAMDVIKAAEKIAQYGNLLNKLCSTVADQCSDKSTRSDLLAYLQRVALYSHQLSITSRVKADVQMISGEMVFTGVDSATSLLTSARNLMNSVIQVVKYSYTASTKQRRQDVKQVVTWRMRAPEKKSLVSLMEGTARTTDESRSSHLQALNEFT